MKSSVKVLRSYKSGAEIPTEFINTITVKFQVNR